MKMIRHLTVFIFLLAIGLLAYTAGQTDFSWICTNYTISFIAYAYLLYKKDNAFSFQYLLGIAILVRLMLIPAFPLLSDDIYRFYWDAWVFDQGLSPFTHYPNELTHLIQSEGINRVYQALNSPSYYSVYPPFLQWIFRLSYFIGGNLMGFTICLKLFILIAECISFWFIYLSLRELSIQKSSLFIYALNPLVIIELCGNTHPEAFMIAGLAILIYGMIKLQLAISAGWGLAIATKLQPLILLPLLVFHSMQKSGRLLAVISGVLIGLVTTIELWMQPEVFLKFWESLRLYYQTFEFNGSIYKIARWMGYQLKGYNLINTIGPLLSFIAGLIILLLALFYYKKRAHTARSFIFFAALSWGTYLLFSTTVHPWYVTPLIAFAVFVRLESFVLWSYLIIYSYVSYSYSTIYEPLWLLLIEYIPVLGFLMFDIKNYKTESL